MDDRVGATSLARTERVEALNEALDHGRYVEIRGDAGVGKSGVLKHLAELFDTEGRIVVLSPGRTQPRGWMTMRSVSWVSTALPEISSATWPRMVVLPSSSTTSTPLAMKSRGRSTTFCELPPKFRESRSSRPPAATSVSMSRAGWTRLLSKLWEPAPPVVIEELSETEVVELSEAEPRLAGLLADGHPARDVVRNLYRLSRLATRPASAPTPTTELDMAEQWWSSADGDRDAGHRERARLVRSLAEMALGGAFVLDVKDVEPVPIDALVRSETLRDLGNDRVAFRHDVLRQWAIGNLLAVDETAFEKLPLDKPTSAILARGVELAARFALEREPNGDRWAVLLDRLSTDGVHGSWRRAVLLALVHSETSVNLLDQESARLLDNDAALLRELIRTVMAVDVEPASQLLVKLGVNPAQIPPGMFVPTGASWFHLIIWLLKLGTKVPAQALGDVAELYTDWMSGMFGHGPLTPDSVGLAARLAG